MLLGDGRSPKPSAKSTFKASLRRCCPSRTLPMSVASKEKRLGLCKRLNARLCIEHEPNKLWIVYDLLMDGWIKKRTTYATISQKRAPSVLYPQLRTVKRNTLYMFPHVQKKTEEKKSTRDDERERAGIFSMTQLQRDNCCASCSGQ